MIARRAILLPILALLSGAGMARGAELVLSPMEAASDGQTAATVWLNPGEAEAVGALQFDIEYEPNTVRFERVLTGEAADTAGKAANFNEYAPGKIRVIVAGLNRNAIQRGPIGVVKFSGEPSSITLAGVILSDPFGSAVPVTVAQQTERGGTPAGVPATEGAANPSSLFAWAVSLVVLLGIAFAAHRVLFAKPDRRRA